MEKTLCVKIQDRLHNQIKEKAKEMNISMGAFVRMALTEYLNKKGE